MAARDHDTTLRLVPQLQEKFRDAGQAIQAIKLYSWRATAHRGLGQFERELEVLESAQRDLRDAEPSNELRALAVDFDILKSTVLRRLSRFDAAIDAAEAALRSAPTGSPLRPKALNFLAVAYQSGGRDASALPVLREVLGLLPPTHPQLAAVSFNVASSLLRLGRTDRALAMLDALDRDFDTATSSVLAMRVRATRGTALMHLHRFEESRVALESALQRIDPPGLGSFSEAVRVRGQLADCLRALRQPDEALAVSRELVERVRTRHGDDHLLMIDALRNLSRSERYIGESSSSRDHLEASREAIQEALELTRKSDSPKTRWVESELGSLLADHFPDERSRAIELFGSAIDRLEQRRTEARAFDPVDRAAFYARLRTSEFGRWDPYEGRAHALLRGGETLAALIDVERARARSAASLLGAAEYEDGEDSILDARRVLRRGEWALVYLVAERRSTVFAVPSDQGPALAFELRDRRGQPVGDDAIDALASGVRNAILGSGSTEPARGERVGRAKSRPLMQIARELFDVLMPADLWARVRSAPLVHVVPHGALHLVPLEVLLTDKRGFWLDAGPPVAYAPSLATLTWSESRRARQQESKTPAREFTVFAGPEFGDAAPSDTVRSLAPLPGSVREAIAIHASVETLAGVHVRTGADATESALFDLAPRTRVLHIATHQIADESSAWRAGRIVLQPVSDPTSTDDGFLDIDDLLDRWDGRLAACELTVLSSCQSRLGRLTSDEGVFGFPLAFQRAGCPAVLSSLWPVGDEATADLMADFYARIAADDEGEECRLLHLVTARRALKKAHPHPQAWAPFVWIGSPR